jgi:serine/threonine-protein kinase
MPPGEVAGMGQVLADALAYLAGKEVFRLDLKPGNIVMADRGPVIADLGTAFQEDERPVGLTQAGVLIGTPAYMAPEVISGIQVDARADIYGLGLVLYECLGGKAPWHDAEGMMRVLFGVLHDPVDLSGLGISQQFRAAIEKATAKNRDERFRDAAAFGEALRRTPEWTGLHGDANMTRYDPPAKWSGPTAAGLP